jgi:hypothetical protein
MYDGPTCDRTGLDPCPSSPSSSRTTATCFRSGWNIAGKEQHRREQTPAATGGLDIARFFFWQPVAIAIRVGGNWCAVRSLLPCRWRWDINFYARILEQINIGNSRLMILGVYARDFCKKTF